jgi:hypothetical protein
MIHGADIGAVVSALLTRQCYSVTHFVSRQLVIRATKPRYRRRKKQWSAKDTRTGLILTIGKPNYRECGILARQKTAFTPFTVYRDFPKPR